MISDQIDTKKNQNQLLKSYTPVFALISALAVKKDYGDPVELSKKLRSKLESTLEYLKNNNENIEVIADAQYAVVAFVDETLNRSQWAGRDVWQKYPLASQMRLQANTGVIFFQKLEDWRKSTNPPANLLEIFYVCLGLGFQGIYNNQKDKLAELQRELLREITQNRDLSERLSPNGLSKGEDNILSDPENFPWIWYVSGAVGIIFIFFIIFKVLSMSQINNLTEKLLNF